MPTVPPAAVLTSVPAAAPTVHLALLPGLVPVLREPGVVQVGLDPPRRALLVDHPDTRRLLAALAAGTPTTITSHVAGAALRDLEAAGLLVDADLMPSTSSRARRAAVGRHGRRAASGLEARSAARLVVDADPGLRLEALRLVSAAGLATTTEPDGATVVLVLGDRPLERTRTDRWLRDGVPHLCVQAQRGGVTVGPFVAPGVTACLRCVDAHLGEHDPRRAMLVEQLARHPGPAPVDELSTTLAVAWAVREVTAYVEGDRPLTWSATLDLPGSPVPRLERWSRHPLCGCAWDSSANLPAREQ